MVRASDEEKVIAMRYPGQDWRGQRVEIAVPMKAMALEVAAKPARVELRVTAMRSAAMRDDWAVANTQRKVREGELVVALDVPVDALAVDVELHVQGGEASFAAPKWSKRDRAQEPKGLADDDVEALRATARLVSYLRYLHPSDESASMDWPALEADVVDRMLASRSRDARVRVLSWLVALVAPTGQLYEEREAPAEHAVGTGKQLTRWVRIGMGDSGEFAAVRTGLDEPEGVGMLLTKTASLRGCRRPRLTLDAAVVRGTPVVELALLPRAGSGTKYHFQAADNDHAFEVSVATEDTDAFYGVRVRGVGAVDVRDVVLACEGAKLSSFAEGARPTVRGVGTHLYELTSSPSCSGCLRIAREHARQMSPQDVARISLGMGLGLRMPLAVWTDGTHTLPIRTEPLYPPRPLPRGDRATRLASVVDIWSTLWRFYPYFDELKLDWERVLPEALRGAAAATSSDAQLEVLSRMVAALRDGHGSVYRQAYDDGVLPLVSRLVEDKLFVVTGVGAFRDVFERGAEVVDIDGEPTARVVQRVRATISAATDAWRVAALPLLLGDGPAGELVSLALKRTDGTRVAMRVPRVARRAFLVQKLAPLRPATGSEVTPGVYYIEADTLTKEAWEALVPKLGSARALICDLRAGAHAPTFHILAHFIDHEVLSPFWDKPIAGIGAPRFERSQWSIVPTGPRFSIPLVFLTNGLTASGAESILQYASAAGIGVRIGESTGGTNGNVGTFTSLADLGVRFTALRDRNQDGSAFHGHGFAPDVERHVTLEGTRAGRDEILEAAMAWVAAQKH